MKTETRWCPYCLKDMAFEILDGSSHAVLWDSSHAVLRDSSHAVLRDSSHAVLWDSSHAVLWGSSHAVLWDSSHAEARSPYATAILKTKGTDCEGGYVVGKTKLSPRQWLELCHIPIKDGKVILYKSLTTRMTSRDDFQFEIGKRHDAPDWDAGYKGECGRGIHYSPTVAQARSFRDEGVYVACEVLVSEMAPLPAFAEYPDKIRAKGGVCLYRVDADGKRIDEVAEAKGG